MLAAKISLSSLPFLFFFFFFLSLLDWDKYFRALRALFQNCSVIEHQLFGSFRSPDKFSYPEGKRRSIALA